MLSCEYRDLRTRHFVRHDVGLFLPDHNMDGLRSPHMLGTFIAKGNQIHTGEKSFP